MNSNNLWSLIEGVSNALFQLCIIALISRHGDLSDVGQYGIAMAISAPLFMLVNMRLRFIYVSGRPECKDSFFLCFMFRVITSSFVAAVIIVLAWVLSPDMALILTAVTLFKYFESLSDFVYSLFHRRGEMVYIARSGVLSASLSVVAAWTSFEMEYGTIAALFFAAFVKMMVFALHDVIVAFFRFEEWGVRKIEFSWVSKIAVRLFPLGVLCLLSSFCFNAPRLFLGWSGDMGAVGIYTGLSQLVLGGAIVVNAIAFPMLRVLGESHMSGKLDVANRTIKNLMYLSALIGMASVVFVFFVGDKLLLALYGGNFQDSWEAFILMMLAGSLYYQVLVINHVGTSTGYFVHIVVWQGLSLVATLIGLYLLVPAYGIVGGGMAWAFGSCVQIVLFLKTKTSMLSHNQVRISWN